MIQWFGHKFPYTNEHELNLDWIIDKFYELENIVKTFTSANSLTFADPILWNITSQYSKNTIVLSSTGDAFLSLAAVPSGIELNNSDYWLEIFNFAKYVRTANSNLTINVEINTDRASKQYNVDDWLLYNDVLYKVTTTIPYDGLIIIDTNIVHFTVEDFCKSWVTYATNLINQYKNDIDASELAYKNEIDASELAYKNQLDASVTATTASLQAQLNEAIAGATVDSEVINARVGADGVTYPTLGEAIRTQFTNALTNGYSFSGSDINTINKNSIYYVAEGTTNLPTNDGGYLVVTYLINSAGTAAIQLGYKYSSGFIYYRRKVSGNWSSWNTSLAELMGNKNNIPFNFGTFVGTDINDIETNSIYYVSEGTTNLPTNLGGYYVITLLLGTSTTASIQLAYRFDNGIMYYRRKISNVWQSWHTYMYDLIMNESKTPLNFGSFAGSDINDIETNSIYYVSEGTTNLPTNLGGYYVITLLLGTSTTASIQIAYRFDNGMLYYRRKISNDWKNWFNHSQPISATLPTYFAYGDSLTYGALWISTEESPYYEIVRADPIYRLPNRIANAIGGTYGLSNKAVGGAYFVGNGDNTIMNQLTSTDISNCKLITIAGGRNDSENTLGDKNSSVDDGTICGAIKAILEYIKTNAPLCQVVWIGVTPNTSNNNNIFTRVFAGGWSLNSFDEKVSELCAEYGVPYIDWKKCTAIRHWADYSGAGNVYSHPNTAEMYLQMGNYLAGEVSKFYIG